MPKAVAAADISTDHDPEQPNHMILWLDASIGNPAEYQHLKKAFGSNTDPRHETWTMLTDRDYDNLLAGSDESEVLFEGVRFLLQAFTDENKCLEAFKKNQNKRIFFITSGSKGKDIVPIVIENYRHVFTDQISNEPYSSIYVFCHSIALHVAWASEYDDYIQIFDFDSDLLERLTRDISLYFIERGERLRKDNELQGALQRLHWAKKLWHQHDKMAQDISTDDRQPVKESEKIKEINKLIKDIELLIPKEVQPSGDNSDNDDDESMDVQTGETPS